ncbi:hypothetical protein [Pseudomonas sp. G(2018)]|uniref:hypothetical protein n=1 Tax=Pseudomonas sp. G(2018) TaxID=2502242 RepID=UPI0010F57AE6|nr:hypothetical protein [Pseudomonas sp. G(2018)]
MSGNKLDATGLYRVSNFYYSIYAKLAFEVADRTPPYTDEEKEDIGFKIDKAREVAEYYSKLAKKSLVVDVKMPVARLTKSIEGASETIKNLKVVGKVLDVVGDLVVIGVTLVSVVTDPTKLGDLPQQVDELVKHVGEVKAA